MSKKNNVNPNHYKVAGRDRQGEDVLQEVHKQEYAQAQAKYNPKEPFAAPTAPHTEKEAEDSEVNKAATQGK